MNKYARICSTAFDILRKGGWCQRQTKNGTQHCLLGALFSNSAVTDGTIPVMELVQCIVGGNYLSAWNDQPERTQQEVEEALLAAASLAMDGAECHSEL